MARIDLTAEQEEMASRLAESFQEKMGEEIRQMFRLLVSKKNSEFFGATEFQLRDMLHAVGAQITQAALEERKKGGTKGRAAAAPTAAKPSNSRDIVPRI